MIVEIHGAGFANKGAELMLHAVVAELRERLPEIESAIDPMYGPYPLRSSLGLYQVFPPRSHVGTKGFSRRFLFQRLVASMGTGKIQRALRIQQNLYGCINISEIDAFLDIAGFAYSDEWGSRPTRDLASLTAYYKAQGKPIIFLPQAFGPFQRDETRSAIRKVLNNASLVFARDQQSYDYLLEFSSDPNKIHRSPDMTLFYPRMSSSLSQSVSEKGYACVVPNIRILDRGEKAWGDKYHCCLSVITKELLQRGLDVKVVVHDNTGEDLMLARRICEECGSGAKLVQEEDPLVLKQLIGCSRIVIGSRYHSLVAAFSLGVPAIAIGWSHKYDMLFHDFDMDDFIFSSPAVPEETIVHRIHELIDMESSTSHRRKIDQRLQALYETNEKMWSLITEILVANSSQQ